MTHKINDNGIDRDMTPDEIKAYDKAVTQVITDTKASAAAADAKAAAINSALTKLKTLGLNDSEIEALLGVSHG